MTCVTDLLKQANAFLLGTRFAREAHAHGLRLPHCGRSASVNIGTWPEPRHGAVAIALMIPRRHSRRSGSGGARSGLGGVVLRTRP